MKIVKPLTAGLLHKTYRHAGRDRLSVAAIGFFRLGADAGHEGRFLTENLQWPAVLASLPEDQPLDEVMPKACGEVLLCGHAHAPEGKPVKEMGVRLSCAGVDKRVRVVGDRQWHYGLIPWYRVTEPQAFASMPLGYARAFGGPRHKGNLVGRGYTGNPLAGLVGPNRGLLPNLEYPGMPIMRHWRHRPPAALGPIDLRWTPRQGRGGTYGGNWLRDDFPGLPSDIDWRIFNRAAEDQWLGGYFTGGEAYRLEGMHPSLPAIAGRLPALHARAFLLRRDAPAEAAEEIPLRWDTVWFLPDQLLGVAVWHGEAEVADCDGEDVAALMVGYERPDAPRDLDHYRSVMALRLDPATAVLHAMNESQLAPARTAEEEAQLAAYRQAAREAREAERLALLQAMHEDLAAHFGEQEVPAASAPPPPLEPPGEEEIAAGDFDLSNLLEQAARLADDARREGEARRLELDAQLAELPAASAPEPDIEARWQEALAKASEPAWDLVGGMPEDDERCRNLADVVADREALAALAQSRAHERRARRAAPKPACDALPAEVACRLGAQALAWHHAGIPLAGRDLAGANLQRASLAGADLREALLENADLSGADLSGARLQGAALTGANLEGATLTGAHLQGANLSGSRGRKARADGANLTDVQALDASWPEADFSGACLDGLLATSADFSGAVFDRCRGRGLILPKARLAGSRWREAQLSMAVLLQASLAGADLAQARLDACVFLDADGSGSRWQGAVLTGVQGGGKADWRAADFSGARLHRCGFNGAAFRGARFAGAEARQCDFGRCDLSAADLSGALLSASLFYGTRLADCRAADSDWFQALCRKADFSGADLTGANLVQAELTQARFDGARLEGVRLDAKRRAA
ncbi:MAG TPA: DUF2169 domain-containing protein [Rhodocyclaceae bacterium]